MYSGSQTISGTSLLRSISVDSSSDSTGVIDEHGGTELYNSISSFERPTYGSKLTSI